jgi:steroid delta-isomerase-like uncharacterized protein
MTTEYSTDIRASRRIVLAQLGAAAGAGMLLSALPLAVSAQAATPAAGDDGKSLVQRFYDAVNTGDEAAIKELLAADFADRYYVFSEGQVIPPGPDAMAAAVTTLRGIFPDAVVSIEEMIAEGDRVAARVVWRGTVPAPYEARQFDFWGVSGGKLTELVGLFDVATFTAQLSAGATPTA